MFILELNDHLFPTSKTTCHVPRLLLQVRGTITTSSSSCSPWCSWEPGCSTVLSCVSDSPRLTQFCSGSGETHPPCCVCYFRRLDSLRAALRGAGPVGRGLRPGQLLSLGAQHLPAGLLPHMLVQLDPATAALPGARLNLSLCLHSDDLLCLRQCLLCSRGDRCFCLCGSRLPFSD